MGESAISIKGLKKDYNAGAGEVHALRGIDMEIACGEFVCIAGKSGSGKSTLLNLVAGLESPTDGSINVLGQRIDRMSEIERIRFRRSHIGFVFQSYRLLPQYTAIENVALPLMLRGVEKRERERRALEALDMVGIAKCARQRPAQMSGGTAGGVTAATAIAALQEAGGKLSRNMIDDGYQAFAQVMTLCIELVRQFYSAPRQFRLLGRGAEREFRMFDNGGMQPKALALGGYRVPEFDLEIAAQDETPYKTMEYNQLALQLFQMGFFRADMAEQALRCLELMEFKNKDQLASVIRQGQQRTRQVAWLQRQLLTAVQLLDAKQGTSLAQALEQEMNGGAAPGVGAVKADSAPDAMERQRKQSREAVRPR